jgi:hypothetical protein
MDIQTSLQPAAHEQILLKIVRTLPPERVMQLLDYARYLQAQTIPGADFLETDETEEEIEADEALWDAQFAASDKLFEKMADAVRAARHGGPRSDRD